MSNLLSLIGCVLILIVGVRESSPLTTAAAIFFILSIFAAVYQTRKKPNDVP